MSRKYRTTYIRSDDGATMVEIALGQYVEEVAVEKLGQLRQDLAAQLGAAIDTNSVEAKH